MRKLTCPACHQSIFFEQISCTNCGVSLIFDPSAFLFRSGHAMPHCANRPLIGCNWAVNDNGRYCSSCSLTRTIPPLQTERYVFLWRRVEAAKRRLLHDLARLKLPLKDEDGRKGVAFDILADDLGQPVMTGHLDGLITLNLSEADDAMREVRRAQFREPYRTLLGHFRHEVGHFYWELLVDGTRLHRSFRFIFGDESVNYRASIKSYHRRTERDYNHSGFISEYATSHPWEDWAETWTHYLHIVDSLETAQAFRLRVDPKAGRIGDLSAEVDFDAYASVPIETIVDAWLPLSFAINSLNRSMGLKDAYPFVLSPGVIEKLDFVHRTVHGPGRT